MPIISDSQSYFGFTQDEQTLVITRSGSVVSQSSTITSSGHTGLGVINDGYVAGYIAINTGGSISILNDVDGRLTGDWQGVRILANSSRVSNQGSITSNTSEAIHVEGAGTHIQNTGTVAGQLGIYLNVEGSSGTISNTGVIIGDDNAVYTEGDGSVKLANAGTIVGNVVFVDGTNLFDGRGGTVNGVIQGGTGVDRIFAGDDGETFGGGKGHDRLVGGAGADTFMFASYSTGDSDVIRQFDTAKDTIQLDHTAFTHLRADQAPTFAIGTKAASPTDLLFYNSQTGRLYYDLDGSGTAHSPYLVATLDTGLALTAKNFDVV